MGNVLNHSDSETRRELLRAALKSFANFGYAATSVRHIVDAARVSKPALYYYFKDKAGLFDALVDQAHDERYRLMEEAAQRGNTLAEKLEEIATAIFEFSVQNRELMRLAFATAFAASGEAPGQTKCREKGKRAFEFFRALMEQGQASEQLDRRFTVDELAMGIYGQLNSHIMVRLLVPECPLNRQTARQIVRLFLEGAGGRRGGRNGNAERRAPKRANSMGQAHAGNSLRKERHDTQNSFGSGYCASHHRGSGGNKGAPDQQTGASRQIIRFAARIGSSVTVRQQKWQETLTAIGSVVAIQGVTISPELAGTVREIAFESGAAVSKGDLLVRLDTTSEEAQLRAIEAQLDLARINLVREQKLREQNMVSQSDLDSADATMKQTQANADEIRTVIEKKTLRAPFSGQTGIRQVNLGQYLDAGKPIVWLQTVSLVYTDFSLPQQDLSRLSNGMPVRLQMDAYPDHSFDGTLTAINPGLDQSTRSVSLRATFDNPNELLRPGMFARVEVLLPRQNDTLVIPATSVLRAPSGDSVFVIEPQSGEPNGKAGEKVRQQLVRLGAERGDFVAVQSGLKAGDRIVSSGQFKLRTGMAVIEQNDVVPKNGGITKAFRQLKHRVPS